MQASSNAGNRRTARRNAQGVESLHRSAMPVQTAPEVAKSMSEAELSPLLLLSRRIREEQGTEGLRAFLHAMEPFAAPYELKNIATRFGMEHHTPSPESAPQGFSANANDSSDREHQNSFNIPGLGSMNGTTPNSNMSFDPNLIRMMQMMNGMGNMNGMNGGNMGGIGNSGGVMQLMQLMRLLPMLQNMGKGGVDPAQIMKNMNL